MATPPPTPTLGELAYTAYWRVRAPLCLPWARVTKREQRAWNAAARAAVRAWDTDSVQLVRRLVEDRD